MHSSRMCTGRSLTVCCSLLPGGVLPAGGFSLPGGFSLVLGGSAWSGGVSLVQGGSVWSGGVLLGREDVSLVPGGSSETPPVYRITDTCENITLATTSLWPVKKMAAKGSHINFMFLSPPPGRWIRYCDCTFPNSKLSACDGIQIANGNMSKWIRPWIMENCASQRVTPFTLVDPRDRKGRAPLGPNSFIFMQFSAKNGKIIA